MTDSPALPVLMLATGTVLVGAVGMGAACSEGAPACLACTLVALPALCAAWGRNTAAPGRAAVALLAAGWGWGAEERWLCCWLVWPPDTMGGAAESPPVAAEANAPPAANATPAARPTRALAAAVQLSWACAAQLPALSAAAPHPALPACDPAMTAPCASTPSAAIPVPHSALLPCTMAPPAPACSGAGPCASSGPGAVVLHERSLVTMCRELWEERELGQLGWAMAGACAAMRGEEEKAEGRAKEMAAVRVEGRAKGRAVGRAEGRSEENNSYLQHRTGQYQVQPHTEAQMGSRWVLSKCKAPLTGCAGLEQDPSYP